MKILITGGCSFIFSNFIRKVLYDRADIQLISIDKIVYDKTLYNIYINNNHTLHIGDITDKHFVDIIFSKEKPDYVINGAAYTFVDDAIKDTYPFINSNILGTQVIIDACLKHGVKKLIHISTDEVLGGTLSENDPLRAEDAKFNPGNTYAVSKAAAEMLVKIAGTTHGLKYNITRCCNNFGPRQLQRNFIPKIIKNILNNEQVPIYGEGKQIREWIHVDDNCDAILYILEKGIDNEIYHISTGNEISNIELFHKIANEMEQGHELLKFVEDRKAHDFRYAMNSDKLKSLGWKPKIKFTEGLKNTIVWYKKNKWWFSTNN